jgi:hypothetical protein
LYREKSVGPDARIYRSLDPRIWVWKPANGASASIEARRILRTAMFTPPN